MKIAWIRIKGFQQFEDITLDFTHKGKALDKICLIGRNGTGKTTILDLIGRCFWGGESINLIRGVCAIKIENGNSSFILILSGLINGLNDYNHVFFYRSEVESIEGWFEKVFDYSQTGTIIPNLNPFSHAKVESIFHKYHGGAEIPFLLNNNSSDLLIYCPSETAKNDLVDLKDVPDTDLGEVLYMYDELSAYHLISNETVTEFWELLIYLIKKREKDRDGFENQADNINKTKRQLIDEFSENNPDILPEIAELWNEILNKAGLMFDYKNAKIPVQNNENLLAYIVNKNGLQINYNKLSTGVRNFIFRFGHIKTLYFNREIKRGLLLVDEPENSLFPDFLLDIIEKYETVTTDKNGERNTQMFFATHSPIIASQFKPEERIILDWNEDGSVIARKGTSPEGDDPNDILYQDFGMTEIVSKKGQEVWKAYLDLKKKLAREKDDFKKKEIAEEILKIGKEYNFD